MSNRYKIAPSKIQLKLRLDPYRRPPTLRHRPPGHNAQKATASQPQGTALAAARHQSTIQLPRHISLVFQRAQDVPGIGVQGWSIPQGSREPGQTGGEPDDGSCGDGGDDGDDEGKHGHDDPANVDHELDQCLFRRFRHQ